MSDPSFNPGGYEITKFVVKSFDGLYENDAANIVTDIEIDQSLDNVSWSGMAKVLDNVGFLTEFPLRGEETLQLNLYSYDTKTTVELQCHIWRIDNIEISESGTGVVYNIHFISSTSWSGSKRKITAAFTNSTNNVVKDIFDQYMGKIGKAVYLDEDNNVPPFAVRRHSITGTGKNLFIQPASTLTDIVIPGLTPGQAMVMLANRTHTGGTTIGQSFRFFETLDGFYFVSDEYLVEMGKDKDYILQYSPTMNLGPLEAEKQVVQINNLYVHSRGTNSGADIISGGYRSKVTEVDLIRKRLIQKSFEYLKDGKFRNMSGEERKISDSPHTQDFIKDTFTKENAREFILYKNYASDGDTAGSLQDERHLGTIAMNRTAYDYHLNSTSVSVEMDGRLDLKPGKIVNLNITNFDVDSDIQYNKELSGKYLIKNSRHNFNKGRLTSQFFLVKYNWSR